MPQSNTSDHHLAPRGTSTSKMIPKLEKAQTFTTITRTKHKFPYSMGTKSKEQKQCNIYLRKNISQDRS